MTEKIIQNSLRQFFDNHKYVLTNSFVFSWESDFFSVTKSGTVYEVEVKISKADYKKDFEKEKHELFQSVKNKKRFIVKKSDRWKEADMLFTLKCARLSTRGGRYFEKLDESFIHEEDSFGYWQRYERFINLDYQWHPFRADSTRIEIIDLEKMKLPNRFYYACPEGLIKEKDLPPYAGLIWWKDHQCRIIKQAPFITKRNIESEITGVLLDKFWYLSQDLNRKIIFHNIQLEEK